MLIVHLTSPPGTTSVAHRGSQNSHAGGEGPGGSRRTTLPLRFRGDSTMERIKRRELFRRAGWGLGALAVSQMLSRLSMPGRAYAQATGTLTYGMAGGFDTLDVTATTFTRVGRIGLHLVDPLVWQTQPGQFAPGLATSWTASPDATSYTFKLRSDVRFHDGTPLTAEAVKVTFDRIVDPETKSQTAFSFIGPYDRTEVVDPYTVRVRFKSPYAAFLDGASTPYLGIISPAALTKYGKDFGPVVFVGSGPFILQSYHADAEVALIRNPNYTWASRIFQHNGAPYLQRLVYRIIPEDATRLATLETGETLFIEDVPTSDYRRLRGARNFTLLEIPQAGSGWPMMLNQQRPPTSEVAVRRGRQHLQFWWETGTDPGGILRILFHSSNAGGGTNRNNYKNQEMDRLIDQIDATADPQKRTELVVRAQQKVIDDAVMAYLADPPSLYAHARTVQNVWVDWGGNYPYFYDTRIGG